MASAWGSSWGVSWGNSWVASVAPPETVTGGGGNYTSPRVFDHLRYLPPAKKKAAKKVRRQVLAEVREVIGTGMLTPAVDAYVTRSLVSEFEAMPVVNLAAVEMMILRVQMAAIEYARAMAEAEAEDDLLLLAAA